MSARALSAVLAAALGLSATAARSADEVLLTGSDQAVWLIRGGPAGKTFDLARRELDGTWQWVHEAVSGRPAAAVAAPAQLHVLFAQPAGHMIFDQETSDRTTALKADDALWPDGAAPLALCEAVDANATSQGGILAVVARSAWEPAGTAPASAPATAPAPAGEMVHLGLFQRLGTGWTHLADWRNVRLLPDSRVFVAATGKGIYVLLSGSATGRNRLARRSGGAWRDLALAGLPADGEALAMLTVRRRLILVLAGPGRQTSRRQLTIATLDEEREAFPPETLKGILGSDGAAATWPAGQLPQITRLGDKMALIWQDGKALRFGTCLPRSAELTRKGDVDVFHRRPPDGAGESLVTNFMWVILLAVFVPMILFRSRASLRPFSLPETLRPGNLGKRLLAGIIDLAPVYFLVSVAYMLSPWAMTEEEMSRLLERMLRQEKGHVPIGLAVAYVSMLGLYVVYCTVMETRTGTTFGKKLMKLRVVGPEGARADFRQCLLRNLLKVIELLSLKSPLFFLVPLIPILTRHRQRFGDLIAHTTVVDARTPPEEEPPAETGPDHDPRA